MSGSIEIPPRINILCVDPLWVSCWSTPQDQHSAWILSELVVDQPPRINTADPLWVGCRSLWVGCQSTPPRSTLCRSSLSWLQILSELAVDLSPSLPYRFNFLSWLSIDPPSPLPSPPSPTDFNFLSWLSIDKSSLPPLPYRFQLSELAVDRPPSPYRFQLSNI